MHYTYISYSQIRHYFKQTLSALVEYSNYDNKLYFMTCDITKNTEENMTYTKKGKTEKFSEPKNFPHCFTLNKLFPPVNYEKFVPHENKVLLKEDDSCSGIYFNTKCISVFKNKPNYF